MYFDFNGIRLYSCDVTLDSAYLDVVGVTYEEDRANKDEFLKAKSGEEEDAIIAKWVELKKKHTQEKKEKAVQAEKTYLGNLDKAVQYLEECRKLGKNVYIDFNGHRLYSADISIDGAYLEVLGMTKAQDQEIREAMENASTEEEKEALIKKWNDIRKSNKDVPDGQDEVNKDNDGGPEI